MVLRDKHLKQYAVEPLAEVRVPGLARIVGGFAEFCRGYMFCATTSDSLFLSISKRNDNLIFIHNAVSGENKKFSCVYPKFKKEDHFANCIKGICYCLTNEVQGGMDICLDGPVLNYDIESLEIAVSIAFCLALQEVFGINFSHKRIYDVTVRAITTFCQHRCNTASIMTTLSAREGYYMVFDLKHNILSFLPDIFKDSPYKLVFTQSGISYAFIKEETDGLKSLVEEIGKSLKTQNEEVCIDSFSGDKKKIAKYLLDEIVSAEMIAKAFSQKDFICIGRVLSKVGKSLVNDLDYSCPETDWLLKRSSEVGGCICSSLIFTGETGVIASVFMKDKLESYQSKLIEYEHFFGLKAKTFEFVPFGAPVVEKVER